MFLAKPAFRKLAMVSGEDSRKDAPKGHLKGLVKSGMGKGRDPRFAQNLLGGLVHMTGLFSISYMACHPSH
jgi:hypothetical protein